MKSKQEAKLSMYDAVIAYCDASSAITGTIPAFTTAFTTFKASVAALRVTAQKEANVISGVAMDKFQAKKDLAQMAATTAAAVYALAVGAGNNELKEEVNFSVSDLLRLKDELLTANCQNIHDLANANIAPLAPYGITAGTLSALSTEISQYATIVPAPRNAASLRSAYGETLVVQFKEADSILKNQMDKIAGQFKIPEPEFYTTYKNNRVIIDNATSVTKVTGTVTSSAVDIPVVGAVITVTGQPWTATSDAAGNYTLLTPVPGIYTLTCTGPSFGQAIQSNVQITLGQSIIVDFILDPA